MTMLKRVVLELARTDGFPDGSHERGYVFVAPLTDDGFIDADAWKRERGVCEVRRFWADEPIKKGLLRHVGQGWIFDYVPGETSDDEPIFKANKHKFEEGNYVTVREQDGHEMPFRVVSVNSVKVHNA
jgi:hypothetical protein